MKDSKLVLVGNPNVGKSVLFYALSGTYAEVSNYPGTTIETFESEFSENIKLVDTPGVYSVSNFNDEEKVTSQTLLNLNNNDRLINVVNACTLEKDLFLTLQLIDLQIPFILVINQQDEAKAKKIEIKLEKLQQLLGIQTFAVSALKNEGIDEIKETILSKNKEQLFKKGHSSLKLQNQLEEALQQNPKLNNKQEVLLWLEEDKGFAKKAQTQPKKDSRKAIYAERRDRVQRIVEKTVRQENLQTFISERISDVLIHPFLGTLVGVFIGVFFLYQVLGVWVAGDIVNITEKQLFERFWNPNVKDLVSQVFPSEERLIIKSGPEKGKVVLLTYPSGKLFSESPIKTEELEEAELLKLYWSKQHPKSEDIEVDREVIFSPSDLEADVEAKQKTERLDQSSLTTHNASKTNLKQDFWSSIGTILAGRYGVLTLMITYLFGVLLPLVWFFYFSWSLLEDSGYLPRLAVLADGVLRKLGLNGRGVIPLVLGFGCVTMAMVTTKLMKTKKEQLIMMILLAIAVPCSAQLGIIQGLLAKIGGFNGWAIWVGVVFATLCISGLAASKLIPGQSSPLILELPPLRIPSGKNILHKTNQKSIFFLQEAGIAFFWASFAITIFQVTGLLQIIISALEPLVSGLLHLPKEVALSFLMGMVRRDFGAFGLLSLDLSFIQVVTACVTLTLFVPCIATLGVMIKERGSKVAFAIWFSSWFIGFGIGALLTRFMEFLS